MAAINGQAGYQLANLVDEDKTRGEGKGRPVKQNRLRAKSCVRPFHTQTDNAHLSISVGGKAKASRDIDKTLVGKSDKTLKGKSGNKLKRVVL